MTPANALTALQLLTNVKATKNQEGNFDTNKSIVLDSIKAITNKSFLKTLQIVKFYKRLNDNLFFSIFVV